jgi:hypothetical protein
VICAIMPDFFECISGLPSLCAVYGLVESAGHAPYTGSSSTSAVRESGASSRCSSVIRYVADRQQNTQIAAMRSQYRTWPNIDIQTTTCEWRRYQGRPNPGAEGAQGQGGVNAEWASPKASSSANIWKCEEIPLKSLNVLKFTDCSSLLVKWTEESDRITVCGILCSCHGAAH